MITYIWKVNEIKTDPSTGAILYVRWDKIGTDENGNVGTFNGATPFAAPETTSMIPLSHVTEANVLDWIKVIVVDQYAEHVDGQIQKQITAKVIVKTPLPWVK